jgi:hypothetical protein
MTGRRHRHWPVGLRLVVCALVHIVRLVRRRARASPATPRATLVRRRDISRDQRLV